MALIRFASQSRFPGASVVKKSIHKAGDPGLISESGRSLGEENGNPLQYSCLGNFKDRGARQSAVYGVSKSWTRLNNDKRSQYSSCENKYVLSH